VDAGAVELAGKCPGMHTELGSHGGERQALTVLVRSWVSVASVIFRTTRRRGTSRRTRWEITVVRLIRNFRASSSTAEPATYCATSSMASASVSLRCAGFESRPVPFRSASGSPSAAGFSSRLGRFVDSVCA